MVDDTIDPIISDAEYRAWIGISAPTSQRQRSEGSGPPFIQLSERRIGYRKSEVNRWLEARTINRVGTLPSAKQAPFRLGGRTSRERIVSAAGGAGPAPTEANGAPQKWPTDPEFAVGAGKARIFGDGTTKITAAVTITGNKPEDRGNKSDFRSGRAGKGAR
jgi:predicted DNA-binding transcriptional regulator AlpA